MARKAADTVSLVDESHKAVMELAEARKLFATGAIGSEQAASHIGLFNATARVLTTAINAEKWKRQQDGT